MWRLHSFSVLTAIAVVVVGSALAPRSAKAEEREVITNSIGMKLTLIPSGEFMMGSAQSVDELLKMFANAKRENLIDEFPRHRVRITKPFFLGAYEVTVAQFREFVEAENYKSSAEKDIIGGRGWAGNSFANSPNYTWRNWGVEQEDTCPVVNVSWHDATAFCAWLSRKEEKHYRLPTEAEWEYACRAGGTSLYEFGNDPEGLAQVGNMCDATAKKRWPDWVSIAGDDGYTFTAPVGRFKPNAFGLYDVHGNALEWTADWHSPDYYAQSPEEDPAGPNAGKSRVLRGGGWDGTPADTRCAQRFPGEPWARICLTGFRVARDP
jgi:formylglycine-generating enzyme required for sulfatase activity